MRNRECLSDENIRRLDSDERRNLISEIQTQFSESDQLLREWKQRITTYYELYMLVQRKRHYQGMANIFVPETLRAVETIVTKLYQLLFATEQWFEFDGGDNDGEERAAIAHTQLCMYEMRENHFKSRVMDALRQMVITGLCVRKILWDYEEVERTIGRNKQDKSKLDTKLETIRDTWTFEPVDLLTLQISDIDVPYNNIQKAIWIGEQYIARQQWVKNRMRKGWFSDVMKQELEDNDNQEATASLPTRDVQNRQNSSGFSFVPQTGKWEVMEKWGLIKCKLICSKEEMAEKGYDEDDEIEGVIVIINRAAIVKLEKNPFWHNQKPYVSCPYVAKEFEFAGIGATQIGESLQQELNDTRNAVMDNKTLVLACMWLKNRNAGIKNQDLQMRPNGVITTNDMEGLKPLRPPELSAAGIGIEAVIKNDLRESVGAASNLQGIAQQGVDTATESTQINQESLGRLAMSAQLFSELILKPTLIFAEYLNYQFYDHIKVINIIGPTGIYFIKMPPEKIAGGNKNVIIKIAFDVTENPAVRRQQLMSFFQSIVQLPPEVISFHYKMLDKIYGMFFNGHDLTELYPNPSPNPDDLPSPEDVRDLCIAEKPVVAQPGQDPMKYRKYLEKEYHSMKYALNDTQRTLMEKAILSYVAAAKALIEQQHQQLIQQQQQMMQGQQQQAQKKGGNIVNRGQTQNTTPFNQTAAPTGSSIRQGLGG